MSRRPLGVRASVALACAAASALAAVAVPAGAGASPRPGRGFVRLAGRAAALPHGARVLGPSAAGATVSADVALLPRDPAALQAFVADVSTPGSPDYHHYLARGDFGTRFGPAPATIAATRSWLASTGLRVGRTSPDGLLVPVTGSVSAVEHALGVDLVDTRLATGRVARFAQGAPTVPTALAGAVQGVYGLSTVSSLRPQLVPGTGTSRGAGTGAGAAGAGATESPHASGNCAGQASGAYTATQYASTFGFSSLFAEGTTGVGRTVGLFELEPFTPSDVRNFGLCYGLTNAPTRPTVNFGATGSQSGEAALDIETAMVFAPGATIKVYEGPANTMAGPLDTYDAMVNDPTIDVISTSWGLCEPQMAQNPGMQAQESAIFAEAAAEGITVVAASGDAGSTDCYSNGGSGQVAVDDPADQPYVTGVGGTTLLSDGATPAQQVWNGGGGAGGGGVSGDFSQPSWQVGPGTDATIALAQCYAISRSSCREVPDVAAPADPGTAYAVYCTACGFRSSGWEPLGGTSAGSPLWAALVADVDQVLPARAGLVTPTLYRAGSCGPVPFTDVTSGSNALLSTAGGRYPATGGYDVASGWGSPAAARVLATLASPPSCPVVTGVVPAKGPQSGGGSVTVSGIGFTGATAVRFGGRAAAFRVVSSTSIVATVPAGAHPGTTVNVTVTSAHGTSPAEAQDRYTYVAPGYWLVASDGGIFSFGSTGFYGSTGAMALNKPIVGMAPTPDDRGYWLVASDGGIFSFGDAAFYGSTGAMALNKPIVGMAPTPDGHGYWLVASDGGIFSFGDAAFYGSTGALRLNKPIVGMAPTPDGRGYWLVASDGGIFSFGDAAFHGSTGALRLNKPIVGMAPTPDGRGYWLVASDGGIFSFGDAAFHGSTGAMALNKPIVGMAPTPDGRGYWLVASDGGIFSFGDAAFHGSTGALRLARPAVGMAST